MLSFIKIVKSFIKIVKSFVIENFAYASVPSEVGQGTATQNQLWTALVITNAIKDKR